MKKRVIDETLAEAKVLGIRNILALRGDPPRDHEYGLTDEETGKIGEEDEEYAFVWAIDLIRYIRGKHGDYFCIGAATYPEGHADESYPTEQSPEHDIPYLIEKTKAGADFLMTQLFYDMGAYVRFEKMLREHDSGVFKDIPIIPGLMPIQSYEILKRTTKLSHASLPADLLGRLEEVKGDDEAVKSVGVDALCEIVEGIKDVKAKGARGFHFYTLNLEKALGFILDRCQLIPNTPPAVNNHDTVFDDSDQAPNGTQQTLRDRRLSSTSSNHLTTMIF